MSEQVKKVEVTLKASLVKGGKPCKKGDVIKVTEAQAAQLKKQQVI